MKIIVAEHFGMCFGVRDAIAKAEKLAAAGRLTILGELVHNPVVREQLRTLGIEEQSNAPSGRVMITAHGISDAKRTELSRLGLEVADGTCPLVRNAHRTSSNSSAMVIFRSSSALPVMWRCAD